MPGLSLLVLILCHRRVIASSHKSFRLEPRTRDDPHCSELNWLLREGGGGAGLRRPSSTFAHSEWSSVTPAGSGSSPANPGQRGRGPVCWDPALTTPRCGQALLMPGFRHRLVLCAQLVAEPHGARVRLAFRLLLWWAWILWGSGWARAWPWPVILNSLRGRGVLMLAAESLSTSLGVKRGGFQGVCCFSSRTVNFVREACWSRCYCVI